MRKVSSTTRKECYLPQNIQKRYNYWNLPYLHGIPDVVTDDVINLDQCGVYIETANRKFGKTFIGTLLNQEGECKQGKMLNVQLPICADQNSPMRWVKT
eukprot:820352-Ditylum_brightwellii.AAC.1